MLINEHAKASQNKRHIPESKQVFTQDQILEDQTILAYRLFTKGMIATNYFLLHLSSVTSTKKRNRNRRKKDKIFQDEKEQEVKIEYSVCAFDSLIRCLKVIPTTSIYHDVS